MSKKRRLQSWEQGGTKIFSGAEVGVFICTEERQHEAEQEEAKSIM